MFIYLASSEVFRTMFLGKIGCTEEPYGRRCTYLTGCPPGLSPDHDINYDAVWETTATTRCELFDMEDEIHNHFLRYRMMREKPGDSEWFDFQGKNPYDEVKRFMESRSWVKREVSISELRPPKRHTRYLRKQYHKNLQFLKGLTTRNTTLDKIQEPVISAIVGFMADRSNKAGYVIAPCGSGKTHMTAKGIYGIERCIIGCPSRQIQRQWQKELLSEGIFALSEIHLVGGEGTTDPSVICDILKDDTFCILTTYMSSHLLVDILSTSVELLILDEAHHMAGFVASEEKGEGRTRRLMMKASELEIKRLSLTYTPRFIKDTYGNDEEYLTMDDEKIFGKKITELNIRDLIRKGVLPDYRLWALRDEAKKGTGILGKAECILEAWEATEMIRAYTDDPSHKMEKHILHHLIVFTATIQEAKELEEFFLAKTTATRVLRVEEGDSLERPLAEFTDAPRAILINCFVLNEGVDIPIANAVAITYPKQSRGQITQMILRAGRWYEGKSLFHLLIPTLGDEDLSGFEEVLSALASCDEQIRDEILLRSASQGNPSDPLPVQPLSGDTVPECIMIEEFEAKEEEIRRCFTNIRKNLFPARESRRIQALCMERGVDTSVEYSLLREQIPELPEDPRPKGVLWYDYLHPMCEDRILAPDFVKDTIHSNRLQPHQYDEWRNKQPQDRIIRLPSIQHISDGFFGKDNINFNTLCEKYGRKIREKRR